jgi:hypothetical protein
MAHDVFISYAAEDRATAELARQALEAAGMRCWIAPRDIRPGMSYAAAIIEAIHNSRVMILVFSARSNTSDQVTREVERTTSLSIPVLPFRIDRAVPSEDMEYHLSSRHWLDAYEPPIEGHLERLVTAVRAELQRAGPAPASVPAAPPPEDIPERPSPEAPGQRPAMPTAVTQQRAFRPRLTWPWLVAGGVALAMVASVATLVLTRGPAPEPAPETLLDDSLEGSTNPWPEFEDADCRLSLETDGYHVASLGTEFYCSGAADWLPTVRDIRVEASVTFPADQAGEAGLECRQSPDADRDYTVTVDTDGLAYINRYDGASVETMTSGQVSVDLERPLRLRLDCVDQGNDTTDVVLYVNGNEVLRATDDEPLRAGYVAVISGSLEDAEFGPVFTNILITDLAPEPEQGQGWARGARTRDHG